MIDQVGVDQDRPHEQRDAAPAHAGRAHVVDRRDEVDRAEHRRQAGEVDHVDPRVLAARGRVLLRRERHVGEPAGLRRGEEQRRVERDAAEQEHPVRPRVDAREGDVARADHQRQQVVREAGPDRHDDEEDHRRPVHGEDLVVLLRREERVLRRAELDPQQQRLDAAQQEEDERRVEVEDPDPLVVGRGDPRQSSPLGSGLTVRGEDLRPRPRATRGRVGGGGLGGDGHGVWGVFPTRISDCSAASLCCFGIRLRCSAPSSRAALMSAALRSNHAWYSSKGTARTRASMFAWLRPHSSAHWPAERARPASALNQVLFV